MSKPTFTLVPAPVVLASAKKNAVGQKKRIYDRFGAIRYANAYLFNQCSDGFVAVNSKEPPAYREVEPAREFENAGVKGREQAREWKDGVNGRPIPWSDLDDCAHFVSCCIGRPYDGFTVRQMLKTNPGLQRHDAPRIAAGGLDVPLQDGLHPWFYGMGGVKQLVAFLTNKDYRLGKEFMSADDDLYGAVDKLRSGDVIAYAKRDTYKHIVLFDGYGKLGTIMCHSYCRKDSPWRGSLTEDARYTFFHIKDEIPG